MNHLIVCREYPPAPSGGIGVYASHIARLLAEHGDTVHVIGQCWEKSDGVVEVHCNGRLLIHRVPYEDGASLFPRRRHPALTEPIDQRLFASEYPPQCFAWRAALLAEKLVDEVGFDVIEAQEYESAPVLLPAQARNWPGTSTPSALRHSLAFAHRIHCQTQRLGLQPT